MTPFRPTCWLVCRKDKGQIFARIVSLLSAAGYSWKESAVEGHPTAENLAGKAPQDAAAVFFCDSDAAWLAAAIQAARSASQRLLPTIWVGEETAAESLLLDMGIDDFFSIDEKPAAVAARLKLRLRDATARSHTEQQLRDQAASLVKVETTLKQREEFLSVCAHDLRSPLGLIQSSLSLALNPAQGGAQLTPMQEELLGRAKRQSGQALALVNDLLDVMALEQGLKPRYQLLSLHQLLGEFYKDYRFQAEQKQVHFHYDNLIPKWRILADADRVRQLLQNLFTNALKFTEAGRNIYLNVSPFNGRRKSDPPYPMIIISVKDEGLGIPESEMQRIFDRFTQIKKYSRADGRGLGLTVAKQISTLHDGNIWVQSVEGKGSTFFVLFPHAISRLESMEGTAQRVLVAEPLETNRAKYFEQLTAWGYEVVFVKDGVEAITLMYHSWPAVVVLTGGLPKIATADVANLLKADTLGSQVPLILAGEPAPSKENLLVDAHIPLPFSRSQWDRTLIEVGQRQIPNTLRRKVA